MKGGFSMKKCKKCHIEKLNNEFHFTNKKRGYLNSICKQCDNKRRNGLALKYKENYIPNPLNLTNKICTTCEINMSVDKFSYCKLFKDGFQSSCNVCRRILALENRNKNKLKNKEKIIFEKICNCCKIKKLNTDFINAPSMPDGCRNECKDCSALQYRARTYGLSEKDLITLMEVQRNKCAICFKSFESMINKDIHIDHCHQTGKVRGILCRFCNLGIGYFFDNRAYLQNAIQYLNNNTSSIDIK